MSEIRILENLIKCTRDMKGCTLTSEDNFKGSNIDILEETSDKKDAKDCLKVFHFLFYFLKKWLSLCYEGNGRRCTGR